MRAPAVLLAVSLLVATPAGAGASESWLIPPVDAPVARAFEAPAHDFAAGHRGLDYQAAPGTAVRAAAAGEVTFAGAVGNVTAVSLEHGSGLRTTYSSLERVGVDRGDYVAQGGYLGTTGEAHPGTGSGLHFGVLLEGRYVDPFAYLGPVDVGDAVHLVPVVDPGEPGRRGAAAADGSTVRCTSYAAGPEEFSSPPNDNVAVMIDGIGSTLGPNRPLATEALARSLGYRPERVVPFSYSGGTTYDRADTFDDIRIPAFRLAGLLGEVGRRFPGADVDLIAHSQGGLVARAYLQSWARPWEAARPRVEHLVTFATPHQGSTLAGEIDDIENNSITGRALTWWMSRAHRGGINPALLPSNLMVAEKIQEAVARRLPDPRATAVAQAATGSDFIDDLAAEDVVYGTRVLTLSAPFDLMATSDRARIDGRLHREVPVRGWNRHAAILGSPEARRLANAFLRDAAEPCVTVHDVVGRPLGRLVAAELGMLDFAYGIAEDYVIGKIVRPLAGGTGLVRASLRGTRDLYRAWRAGGYRAMAGLARGRLAEAARAPERMLSSGLRGLAPDVVGEAIKRGWERLEERR